MGLWCISFLKINPLFIPLKFELINAAGSSNSHFSGPFWHFFLKKIGQ
jgi:hypothetical protein